MSSPESNTLESLCLDVIICHFDKFCAAFVSKENNLEFYLEFIQRRWSAHILVKLFQRSLLKNEHLQIVINKHTKELDFQNILHCDMGSVVRRLEEMGSVVQKVFMNEMPLLYHFDRLWCYLTNVHTIELQCTSCFNQSLCIISENCPHLKNINLFGCCRVDDRGLTHFIKNKLLLESLNVEDTKVTYKGVASVLQNISSLKKLWHANVPKAIFEVLGLNDSFGAISCDKIFNLNNLVMLNNAFRPENHLISILRVCQSTCPYVNDLTVFEIMSEEQLSLCCSFPDLNIVNLQCSLINKHSVCINEFLRIRGEKIHTLSLGSFSLTFEILLRNCPNLENLTLDFISFENIPFINSDTDVRLSHLKILNLHNFEVSEENVKSISCLVFSSPNLEEFKMCRCKMSDEITDAILNYPKNLKVLNFSNTSVDASFLEEVLKVHKTLKALHIDNSGISPDEYDDLMDIVDGMESKVKILWADYAEAIRQLYQTDVNSLFHVMKRQVMKL